MLVGVAREQKPERSDWPSCPAQQLGTAGGALKGASWMGRQINWGWGFAMQQCKKEVKCIVGDVQKKLKIVHQEAESAK